MRSFKHLSFHDRLKIEVLYQVGYPIKEIAEVLGVHISTIYREIRRGQYEVFNADSTIQKGYSSDIAEQKYRTNLSAKGAPLKISRDCQLACYIEKRIKEDKYSPAAVLGEIKTKRLSFSTTISINTLYNYIDRGIFLRLTNKNLPIKGKVKRPYRQIRRIRSLSGDSIEKRPVEVAERSSFGHWEMDTVIGRIGRQESKGALLVLTERLTRNEIIVPMKDKTAKSVVTALNGLEHRYQKLFSEIFLTITVDNGSEFINCTDMEKSCLYKGNRTKIYYCHPYSSWQRGSNENQNKMIRRHLPKGHDFSKEPSKTIKAIEEWINNYPRGILDYHSSAELFKRCVATICRY